MWNYEELQYWPIRCSVEIWTHCTAGWFLYLKNYTKRVWTCSKIFLDCCSSWHFRVTWTLFKFGRCFRSITNLSPSVPSGPFGPTCPQIEAPLLDSWTQKQPLKRSTSSFIGFSLASSYSEYYIERKIRSYLPIMKIAFAFNKMPICMGAVVISFHYVLQDYMSLAHT